MKKLSYLFFILYNSFGYSQPYFDFWQRGDDQLKLKNYQQAIIEYDKAITINPNSEIIYNNRAAAKTAIGDYRGAIMDCNKAIKINSQAEQSYCNRGIAKGKLNNHLGAIQDFDVAIKITSKFPYAYYHRGLEKIGIGKIKEGCTDLKKAEELGFEDTSKALIKYCVEYFPEAESEYHRREKINPDDEIAFYNRGNEKAKKQDYIGAIADYDKAIEINPNYSAAYYNRGDAKLAIERKRDAILDYDKAIELKPDHENAYASRGIAKWRLGDLNGAVEDYSKVIAINPKDAHAHIQRGLLKLALNQKEDGCLEIRNAGKLGLKDEVNLLLKEFCKEYKSWD